MALASKGLAAVMLLCHVILSSSFTTRAPFSIQRIEHATKLFMGPEPGAVVKIECCLRPEGGFIPEPLVDGICVDQFDEPKMLSFVLSEGNYLPGLHELVSSMKVGGSAEATLDAGWGDRNPNLEAWVQFADMEQPGFDRSQIEKGVKLMLANGLKAEVTEVTEEKFKIDANPPLAGASYKASVKLLGVEEGPVESVYPEDQSSSRFQVATFALGKLCPWFPASSNDKTIRVDAQS